MWRHNFAGLQKNKRLLILKFGIWETCLYFQHESLEITHLTQISDYFQSRRKHQISPNQIHLSWLQVQTSCWANAGSSLQLEISSFNDIRTRWELTSRGGRSSGGSWKYTSKEGLDVVEQSCDTVDLLRTRKQSRSFSSSFMMEHYEFWGFWMLVRQKKPVADVTLGSEKLLLDILLTILLIVKIICRLIDNKDNCWLCWRPEPHVQSLILDVLLAC